MRAIQVREIMIPIADYVSVKKENNLLDVLQALENARSSETQHAHRDAVVVDDSGTYNAGDELIYQYPKTSNSSCNDNPDCSRDERCISGKCAEVWPADMTIVPTPPVTILFDDLGLSIDSSGLPRAQTIQVQDDRLGRSHFLDMTIAGALRIRN